MKEESACCNKTHFCKRALAKLSTREGLRSQLGFAAELSKALNRKSESL